LPKQEGYCDRKWQQQAAKLSDKTTRFHKIHSIFLDVSGKQKPRQTIISFGAQDAAILKAVSTIFSFFHPDFTVDPGISPGRALEALVGFYHRSGIGSYSSAPCPEGAYLTFKHEYSPCKSVCQG